MVRSIRPSLFLTALLFAACSGDTAQFVGECKTAADCPTGTICLINPKDQKGLCACRSDEACAEGEVCNSQHVCQKRSGCRSNLDCESAKFCDLATGACIDRTACGADVHCLPGTTCESGRCVSGCSDVADCPLYSACEKPMGMARGNCMTGRCSDSTFCAYGSKCTNGNCVADTNPSHCAVCDGSNASCPGTNDYCLINSGYDPGRPERGSEYFCGVECNPTIQDCPSGYSCNPIILVSNIRCTNNAACGGMGRGCVIQEGETMGFCTCASDADCTLEDAGPICVGTCGGLGLAACLTNADCQSLPCDLTSRFCLNPDGTQPACTDHAQCQPRPLCGPYAGPGTRVCLTSPQGQPLNCGVNADCLCIQGRCVNSDRPCSSGAQCVPSCQNGGCLIGAGCGPIQGLYCPDVRR